MTVDYQMPIFRVAQAKDIDPIAELVSSAGQGITTLPKSREEVEDYIERSNRALAGDEEANRILFVLERNGEVLGVSGIIPELGLERPFYSFKRSRHARRSVTPPLSVKYETLQLTAEFDGYTEVATLFLSPEARGGGYGRLLSFGRLAFIAQHRHLFSDRIMAEIRGWVDEQDQSPFWDGFTSRFIPMEFHEADEISFHDGRFIVELLPDLPILLNLLPDAVSHSMGRPHDQSAGAFKLLESVGFKPTDLFDVFDGGPSLACGAGDTLVARTLRKAKELHDASADQRLLQCSGQGAEFRATALPGNLTNASTTQAALDTLGVSSVGEVWLADMGSGQSRPNPIQQTPNKNGAY